MKFESPQWSLATSNSGIPSTDYTITFDFKTKEKNTGFLTIAALDGSNYDRCFYMSNKRLYHYIYQASGSDFYEITNSVT